MTAALRLVLADLRARTALIVGAAALVAAPIAGYLLLDGFKTGLDRDFASQASSDLIVQEANSIGEVAGSRIDPAIEADLMAMGVTFAIPEIHAVAGSSADNAVLLRGVDLTRYRSITSFEILSGRGLEPDDPDDTVMLGVDLAESAGVTSGQEVALRGRAFRVVGVFEIGTYTDNEAWLSLDAARSLLGWDDEVSIFVVPDDGTLSEGQVLPGPLSVARRGDVVRLADEWDPIMALAESATIALAAAATIVLAVVLWRLAWLRRRDLAILRTVGLGREVSVAYLGGLGLLVATGGLVGGIIGALAMGRFVRIEAFGIVSRAVFSQASIVRGSVMTGGILVFAVMVATARMLRARPAALLRGE
jgi:ABC-type lipoprotein release transport system permease subunit